MLVAIQDGKPVPKIIDFGVAKALAQPLTDKTMFTEHGQVVGTPAYMSPEQAEMTGLNVDTRTDIYSLGVMLYQLLIGVLPFDPQALREAGYSGMMQVIRESDPPRPSTRFSSLGEGSKTSAERRRTDPAKLRSVLEGDLDWVVMKAIEKDRNRRYETANGLAMDLRRYLAGEAVLAAPPSRAYLLKKLIHRHRGAVAATGAVAAAVLIGLVAFAWQARVASGQRDRAQRAEAEARARADELAVVADFQAGMLEQIDATASGIFLTEDVTAKLGTALEEAGLAADERTAQLEAFRRQWVRVNATDTARDLIVHSILTPAVKAVGERFADQPVVAAQLRQVLGDRYRELGLYDAAQPLQRSALETRRRELGDEHPDTLTSVHNMTVLLVAQGKADEAEAFSLEALEGRRKVLGDEHAETLDSMEEMGTVLKALGRFDEAEAIRRESLATYRRVYGDDDPGTLNSINNLGMLLDEMDRAEEALPLIEEALEGRRRALGEDHPDTLVSINNVGYILLALGRADEAEPYYRECLERSRRVLGEEHPETLISINNLGYLFYTRGEMDQAEPYFREAMETAPPGARRRPPRGAELDQQLRHGAARRGQARRGRALRAGSPRGTAAGARRGSPDHPRLAHQPRHRAATAERLECGRARRDRSLRDVPAGARRRALDHAHRGRPRRCGVRRAGQKRRGGGAARAARECGPRGASRQHGDPLRAHRAEPGDRAGEAGDDPGRSSPPRRRI